MSAKQRTKKDFLKEASELLNESSIYWRDNHDACRTDYTFFHEEGGQWDEQLKRDRQNASRPCVSVHLLIQFIQLIVNQQRQNKFANKLSPVGSTDSETVSIMQDIVAYIERRADINTETIQAYEDAVIAGMGAVRIHTEYQHHASFDQEIKIEAIKEPWRKLYFDPYYDKKVAQDMRWCFLLSSMKRTEFEKQYPNADSGSMLFEDDSMFTNINFSTPRGTVPIAEYYRIEEKEKTLIGLDDGQVVFWEDLDDYQKMEFSPKVVRAQKRKVPKVMYYKITGSDILEERELPCEQIPVVPIFGASYTNRSRKMYYGIVRHTKDAQRMYNVYTNMILEHVLMTPIAPFVAAKGSLDGVEHKWKTAHTYNYPYLEYKPRTDDGVEVGPPSRMPFPAIPNELTQHLAGLKHDLSSTTGIYSAKLGNTSNETSGRAIAARIGQSDVSTFHFLDNFQRSFREIGRIFLQIVPFIFDTFRIIRIRDLDGKRKALILNSQYQDPRVVDTQKQQLGNEQNLIKIAELEIRNSNFQHYDVEINAEVTQNTRRAEQFKQIAEFMELMPEMWRMQFLDYLAENMDIPNREAMIARLRQMMFASHPQQQLPPPSAERQDAKNN